MIRPNPSTRGSTGRRAVAALAVLAAFSMTAAACGRSDSSSATGGPSTTATAASKDFIDPKTDCTTTPYQPTQGISGDTITIGTVAPASGPAAIYNIVATGIQKYFDAQNLKGGIKAGDGKTYKVNVIKEDDGYDPGRTPGVVKDLVEQKGVFGLVGSIGTSTNLSVRQYLNDRCVPSIALATGSTEWGKANDFPWYIGGLPSYALEAHAFMDWLKTNKPQAKIALLYQNDDFGQAYQATIKKEIAGTQLKVVKEQSYDVAGGGTTESATAELAASGADVFFVGVTGTACPATLGFMPDTWKPLTYVNLTCTGKTALALAKGKDEGVYGVQATLDPGDATDAKDPKVQQFFTDGASVGLSPTDMEGGIVAAGWGFASIFAAALAQAKEVTRAGVMNAAYSLKKVNFGLMRNDAEATTNGAKDPWILEGLRVVQRKSGGWVQVTPLTDYNGKSNDYTG